MQKYALEHEGETLRLERQSLNPFYDFTEELANFHPKEDGTLFDAGCGSGVVARFIARKYPHSHVIAGDFSKMRVHQANHLATGGPQSPDPPRLLP